MNTAQTIALENLHESPYALIICYPKLTQKELHDRLRELKQLKIIAIEFAGKKTIHGTPVLGKGCVGVVVKAFLGKRVVALKIRRVDADRKEMSHEAEMLEKANALDIGPRLVCVGRNFLVMEYVEGMLFPEWLKKIRSKQRIRSVIHQALEQCWQLDKAGLDHGELSHAPKHIIIKPDNTPTIIDFETASTTRKTQNLTALTQYFFIANQTAEQVSKKLGAVDKEKLIQALKRYKEARTPKNYENVL
jgi:putative serine/threonine protein kinase